MSEMPYYTPHPDDPLHHRGLPPVGDPPHLPEEERRDPELPLPIPLDVPPPPHEPNDPHPLEVPLIGDPIPSNLPPAGDPLDHYPTISA